MIQDDDAVDVSRITGIPWYFARVQQRGPLHPVIDCRALSEVDRLRVAFALIGAHYYCDTVGDTVGGSSVRSGDSDHLVDRVAGGTAR